MHLDGFIETNSKRVVHKILQCTIPFQSNYTLSPNILNLFLIIILKVAPSEMRMVSDYKAGYNTFVQIRRLEFSTEIPIETHAIQIANIRYH